MDSPRGEVEELSEEERKQLANELEEIITNSKEGIVDSLRDRKGNDYSVETIGIIYDYVAREIRAQEPRILTFTPTLLDRNTRELLGKPEYVEAILRDSKETDKPYDEGSTRPQE